MEITNKLGFSKFIEDIFKKNYYDGEFKDDRFSTTEILNPPKQIWLRRRHREEIKKDIISLNWTTFGSLVHYALQQLDIPFIIKEQRLRHKFPKPFDNLELSGGFDVYNVKRKEIIDYKFTSAWNLYYGNNTMKYYKQLMIYAWLLEKEDFRVDKISNVLLFKDWKINKYKEMKDKGLYPPTPFFQVEYDKDKLNGLNTSIIHNYLKDRIKHIMSFKDTKDDELPKCKDRWNNNLRCKQYCDVAKYCHFGKKYYVDMISKQEYNDYKSELNKTIRKEINKFKHSYEMKMFGLEKEE